MEVEKSWPSGGYLLHYDTNFEAIDAGVIFMEIRQMFSNDQEFLPLKFEWDDQWSSVSAALWGLGPGLRTNLSILQGTR